MASAGGTQQDQNMLSQEWKKSDDTIDGSINFFDDDRNTQGMTNNDDLRTIQDEEFLFQQDLGKISIDSPEQHRFGGHHDRHDGLMTSIDLDQRE